MRDPFLRLRETFLQELEDLLLNWDEKITQADPIAAKRTLHNLKGSSATVGLETLVAYLHDVESRLENQDSLQSKKILTQVLSTLKKNFNDDLVPYLKAPLPLKQNSPAETLRVSLKAINPLLSDLNRLQSLLERQNTKSIHRQALHLAREAQISVASLKVIPCEALLERARQSALEAARVCQKEIHWSTSGDLDLEMDRLLIDQLSDPLTHLIRNAIDHGLETPQERKALGKPETGSIHLQMTSQAEHWVITLEDDGKGISLEAITQKALQKGFITPETKLSDESLISLIFEPGFSTQEQVNTLSGRGVGLDVVRYNVNTLGGEVSVKTKTGHGTTFCIKVPRLSSVIDGVVFDWKSECIVVPSYQVGRAQPSTSSDLDLKSLLFHESMSPPSPDSWAAQVYTPTKGLLTLGGIFKLKRVRVIPLPIEVDLAAFSDIFLGGCLLADGRTALIVHLSRWLDTLKEVPL